MSTNIAVLKLATPQQAQPLVGRVPKAGELVSAYGADSAGGVSVRLGTVIAVGDEWHSLTGGRIDKRLGLDLEKTAEGFAIPRIDLGVEYLHGSRENKDGNRGTADQAQIVGNFRF